MTSNDNDTPNASENMESTPLTIGKQDIALALVWFMAALADARSPSAPGVRTEDLHLTFLDWSGLTDSQCSRCTFGRALRRAGVPVKLTTHARLKTVPEVDLQALALTLSTYKLSTLPNAS